MLSILFRTSIHVYINDAIAGSFLILDKPSPPINLHATETGKDFIVVAWQPSESDGGEPITSYVVERKNVTKQSWIKVKYIQFP